MTTCFEFMCRLKGSIYSLSCKLKMYTELFWVIVTFGTGILFTYGNMMQGTAFLGSVKEPIPLTVWIPCFLLTVASFVYVSVEWIWYLPADSTVLGMYCIFLLGALLWAPMITDAIHREEKTISVAAALWLAAAGCIGLLVMACKTSENPLMIVASSWLVIHHTFVDAIWWYTRWHLHGNSRPLFSLGERLDTGSSKDGLDYI